MTVPREVLVRLRDGRAQRDAHELHIYARFLELLLNFVALPKSPPKDDLFWFRFFGVLCGEVPVHTFASALRLHLILDHKQNLPNPGVFETIMMHTVDCEDEDGKIESSEWSSFLARYGPASKCPCLSRSQLLSLKRVFGFCLWSRHTHARTFTYTYIHTHSRTIPLPPFPFHPSPSLPLSPLQAFSKPARCVGWCRLHYTDASVNKRLGLSRTKPKVQSRTGMLAFACVALCV
jgi:hypothetical protein